VAYRETITQDRRSSRPTLHKKQTGGSGQYAKIVTIAIENTGPGGGYQFVDQISGGRIPKEYIPSVDVTGSRRRSPPGCSPGTRPST
jgi:elongation factor G